MSVLHRSTAQTVQYALTRYWTLRLEIGGRVADIPDNGRPQRASLGADLIIPMIGSALAAYYLLTTAELDWEAKSAGLFVGTVLLALCAVQFVRTIIALARGTGTLGLGELVANTRHNRQRLALIVLVALFIATISWTGTTLGLFCLIIAAMLVMGVREPARLLGVAFCTSAVVYFMLIYLLDTRLPRGVIEKAIAAALNPGS